jgi:ribose transport system substrate-binding protein
MMDDKAKEEKAKKDRVDHQLEINEELDAYKSRGISRREVIKRAGASALVFGVMGSLLDTVGGSVASASTVKDAAQAVTSGKKLQMLDVGFGDVIAWCDQIRDSTKFWGGLFNVNVTHMDGGAVAATQLSRLEDIVSSGKKFDFFAVCPIESNTLTVPVKKLISRGSTFIQQVLDVGKPGEDVGYLTFVSCDFVDVGKTLSSYLFEKIGGHGTAIITHGVAGTSNVIDRQKGVQLALKNYPGIDVLAVGYTDYSDAMNKTLWESYCTKFKKIDVAVTFTTGDAALYGTYAALKAAGRAGKTLIGSNNAEAFACQAVINGQLAATIRHSSNLLGMWAATIGAAVGHGVISKNHVPKMSWMPDQLVTNASEAQSMIFLQQNGLLLA